MDRRTFLTLCAGGACQLAALGACRAEAGETLHNGIVLPKPWPPNRPVSMEPETPPYLLDPPGVIPIDLGRQLFVDDFLIDHTRLVRTFHRPTYYTGNPILQPDRPWEQRGGSIEALGEAASPTAMVFSDGVFWDPDANLFRMWCMSGYTTGTSCAVSSDGINWVKPNFDVVPGTNIVLNETRNSVTVWRDAFEQDPSSRFKMTEFRGNQGTPLRLFDSPDGIHWRFRGVTGPTSDGSTVFYNPFRHRWIYSLRDNIRLQSGRYRRYWESPAFAANVAWRAEEPVPWVSVDRLDQKRDGMLEQPEMYALDCVAYESVLLGLFTIWRGDPHERPKLNEVFVGFSRDGFHWSRPDRTPFLPLSERPGDWNWGNLQSAGGCCVVKGEELCFYVSGRAGQPGIQLSGRCTTGLATLRRDGFCSMDSASDTGTLTTRPVRFSGRALFVNAAADGGELRVEILDRRGRPIEAFSRDNAIPIVRDATKQAVGWRSAADLASLRDQPVRVSGFIFHAPPSSHSGSVRLPRDKAGGTSRPVARATRAPPMVNGNRRTAGALLFLLAATLLLYAPLLQYVPAYLAHDEVLFSLNAYSIATTGHDVQCRFFQLFFQINARFWATPIIIYTTALFLKVRPLSETVIRLPSVLVGVADVLLVYLVGARGLRNRWLAMLPFGVLIATVGVDCLLRATHKLWRAVGIALLVAIPLQFGLFYHDYFTAYRLRSSFWFERNLRGAFEDILARDREQPVPVVYISTTPRWIDWYWKFYLAKAGQSALLSRTTYLVPRELEPAQMAPHSVVFGEVEEIQQSAVFRAGAARVTAITEPDGKTSFIVFEK